MMYKKFFVAALALFALVSINAHKAQAQSCQTRETYGVRAPLPVDKNMQSQIEVTYFTTDDPNAFISEKAGLSRSVSYLNLSTNQFVARLDSLEKNGLASVRKREASTSYLGEVAMLNLERESANSNSRMVNASLRNSNSLSGLNRQSEVSVYRGSQSDGEYYRVSLLSWFVNSAQKSLDFDAIVLLKPGQTAVFKLMSDKEIKRTGSSRAYVAITMRSVNNGSLASLRRGR